MDERPPHQPERPASPLRRPALPTVRVDGASPDSARFGKFVCAGKLGAGGMGEVWKAWDAQLQRWVALKFLKGTDEEEVRRFVREAQTAGALNHPNIAAVYEAGEAQGHPYIAMQFVDGETLKALPRSDRRRLVRLVRDAALALHFAHEQGVVHRDLKPDNLMVSRDHVYVMDFGLAKRVEGDRSVSGSVVGTPSYMSPEQARAAAVDARSDVYSLGATLYELLAGRKPFVGGNVYQVLRCVEEEDPAAPRSLNPAIEPDLETLILKCLEKDPRRRFPTAKALADDLTRWLEGEPIDSHPPSSFYRLRKKLAKRRGMVAALAGLLAVTAVGLVAIVAQARKASEELARKDAERKAGEERLRKLGGLWMEILERKRDLRQLRVKPPEKARKALEEAVQALDGFIAQAPDEPQGPYVKARGLLYLDELDRAEEALAAVLRRHPDFRPGWALKGILAFERYQRTVWVEDSGDRIEDDRRSRALLAAAEDHFRKGWPAGREREEAERWGLTWTRDDEVLKTCAEAKALEQAKRPEEARRLLERAEAEYLAEEYAYWRQRHDEAIERAPGWALAHVARGTAHLGRQRWSEAIVDYGRALELNPRLAVAHHNRGLAREAIGDVDGAIDDYDGAIRIGPPEAETFINRANARRAKGDLVGAMADYDAAIGIRPRSGTAYSNRGTVRAARGDLEGAIEDYNRAIELLPESAKPYNNRGAARQGKDLKGAIADYGKAIELDPGYAMAFSNRGTARLADGDVEGAIADFGRVIEIDPRSAKAYYNRAIARGAQGDMDGAMADYGKAIDLQPGFAEAHNNRGGLRARRGDLGGAIADFEAALRAAPPNWPHRAEVEKTLEDARRTLK